jgi:hypothetical protein
MEKIKFEPVLEAIDPKEWKHVGTMQAERTHMTDPLHFYKGHAYGLQMKTAIEQEIPDNNTFKADMLLVRVSRPNPFQLFIYVFEPVPEKKEDEKGA